MEQQLSLVQQLIIQVLRKELKKEWWQPFEIVQACQQAEPGFHVDRPRVYPALGRLEERGLLESRYETDDEYAERQPQLPEGQRNRFPKKRLYRLSADGRRVVFARSEEKSFGWNPLPEPSSN